MKNLFLNFASQILNIKYLEGGLSYSVFNEIMYLHVPRLLQISNLITFSVNNLICWLFQSQTICWKGQTVQNEPKHYCNNKQFFDSHRYEHNNCHQKIKIIFDTNNFSFLFSSEEDYWEEFFA